MFIQNFHEVAGNDAGGTASVGRGKLALVAGTNVGPPLLRLACRDAHGPTADEQDLLAHIIAVMTAEGYAFSRALVVD